MTEFDSLKQRLLHFVHTECIPAEQKYKDEIQSFKHRFEKQPRIMEELKEKAKQLGLWNLFLTKEYYPEGAGLTNSEYAELCEIMGKSVKIAPEACNCNAPDTGNMELLLKYGTKEQNEEYLKPLLQGQTSSAFAMTEPAVASSDATNVSTTISRNGDHYVVDGKKWWISNAGHPNLSFFLVLGVCPSIAVSAGKHKRHAVIIVPKDTSGVKIGKPLQVFGYDDAVEGHCEVEFCNVKVPLKNIILGEGRGFEIIQGRLGPGRIHHCMRAIGIGERCLEDTISHLSNRTTFNIPLLKNPAVVEKIGNMRVSIEAARALVLHAARSIDQLGSKRSRKEIAVIKIFVPRSIQQVVDDCVQLQGGRGVNNITAELFAAIRCLRIADGPDEVHLMQLGRDEIRDRLKSKL